MIREAARRVLAGATLHSITTGWNAKGITTPTGKRWALGRVRSLLLSPQLAGLRVYGPTGLVVAGDWSAVISREQHELLKIKLNDPARNPNGKRREPPGPRRYVLTGLVHCSLCGQRMLGNARRNKGRTYTCSVAAGGCGRVRVMANHLEDVVAQEAYSEYSFLETWSQDVPEIPPQVAGEPAEEERLLLQQLGELEDRRNKLADDLASGGDPNLIYRANERLRTKIEEIERELALRLRTELSPSVESWRGAFERADDFERRRLEGALTPHEIQGAHDWIRAVIERIVIHPTAKRGARFDPSRVEIVLRRSSRSRARGKKAS